MDIKAIVEKLVELVKADPEILAEIKNDPVKTIEKLINQVIPADSIKEIVSGLEEKLGGDALKGVEDKLEKHGGLSGIFDAIKKLF